MRFAEKIKSVKDSLGSMYVGSSLAFPQLDIEKLKSKLKLKEEALARGAKNIPLVESTSPDDVEQKIIETINNEIKDISEEYHNNQRSYEDRINNLSSIGSSSLLESIAVSAEADFQMQYHKRTDELHDARASAGLFEEHIKKFKRDNDLDRPAIYPENRFLHISVIILLIVIETAFSGNFFAKGDEYGLVGGYIKALIPSGINITLGYFLGNCGFRFCISKNILKRLSGIFLCILIPVTIFAFNILVAHYRAAIADMAENATKVAFSNFAAGPFALNDVESWLLIIMGSLFAIIATIDFWKMDDPYPEFGAKARTHKKKIDYYAAMKSDALEELEEIRNDTLEGLEEIHHLINSRYRETQTIIDAQNRWKLQYKEHLDHLEGVGNILIDFYRNTNISVRTEKPPKYFNKAWKLEKVVPANANIDFGTLLETFRRDGSKAESAHIDCVTRITKAYSQTFAAYQTIDQLKPEELKTWLTNQEENQVSGKENQVKAA